MNEVGRIANELSRGYDGDPWHGSSVKAILEGISAGQAEAHPIPSANSIWEIVLHMTGWVEEIRLRLGGKEPTKPTRGEWPPVTDSGDSGWESAKSNLAREVERLIEQLASIPEERLWETPGHPTRDRAAGTGTTFYVLLHGLVQHNVYHSAQIATIKRLL